MSNPDRRNVLLTFPITGQALAHLISLFPPDLSWTVKEFESLSAKPSKSLRDLLKGLQQGAVATSTARLSDAVRSVDQVISMTANAQGNDETAIVVEDGDLITVVVSLAPAQA